MKGSVGAVDEGHGEARGRDVADSVAVDLDPDECGGPPAVLERIGTVPRPLLALVGALALSIPVANLAVVGWVFDAMGNVAASSCSRTRRPVGALLAEWWWLGLRGLVGTLLWLFVPSAVLAGAWVAGWIISFENVGSYGPLLYYFGMLMVGIAAIAMAPVMALLPIAQVRFAVRRDLRAFAEVREIVATFHARPWAWARRASAVPGLTALHVAARLIYTEWLFVPGIVLATSFNLILLLIFVRSKRKWASLYAERNTRPGRAAPTSRPAWLAPAFFGLALLESVAILASFYLTSFGLFDFFNHPLFTIPAVPWAGGLAMP